MKIRMLIRTAVVAVLLLSAATVLAAPAPPRTFILDASKLTRTREAVRKGDKRLAPALAKLKREADAALTAGPFSVMHKDATPPSGDKHDYMTYAPYWWPDPKKPDGLPYIRRDGETNPEINKVSDRNQLNQMVESVETLSLAYYFTGDEKYAERACTLIRTWFIEPATRMNPSFQFAQSVRGRDTGRGFGLIESHPLTGVVDSVGLLAESKAWTQADEKALRAWFEKFLDWMLNTEMGRDEAASENNHGTYYDVQVAGFALFLEKPDLARKVLEDARAKRIAVQVEPDGRQPLELVRTRAWSYSVANLRGLMKLATLSDHVDVDLWGYRTKDGRSIQAAIEYLVPFSLDGKKWPHQQIRDFPADALHPLLRQAAVHYPSATFSARAPKLPLKRSDRENLTQ
jgi:hypothetical protein